MNAKEVETEMELVSTRNFGDLPVQVYENPQRDFFMTRDQIGTALEYGDPVKAIGNIHQRNRDRLDPLSGYLKLRTPGGKQSMFCYNLRGVMEICRLSRQPKADAFMDFCWNVMEALMRGESVSLQQNAVEVKRQARFDSMTEKLNNIIEAQNQLELARKQDRQAIENVLSVCKQLAKKVETLQPGSYTPRKNPKGQSEWRNEVYEIVRKINALDGSTINGTLHWAYDYITKHYGWDLKTFRREYIDKMGYKGNPNNISGFDVIEADDMYKSIFMSVMKDKLEDEKYNAECKKGIVASLVKSKCPAPIPKEVIPVRHPIEMIEDEPVNVVAEVEAVEVKPKRKSSYQPSILKPIVDPIAEKLGDKSSGYQQTYLKIYKIIGADKINRLTRKYIRDHNKPPKFKSALFKESDKALKLFESAAKELAASI